MSAGPGSGTDRQTRTSKNKQEFYELLLSDGGGVTSAWEVMTVGVSVLVADPGASKLLTAAFTCRGTRG